MTDNLQKTESNAALSCPFCGSANVEAHTYSNSDILGASGYVQCNGCSTTGPEANIDDEAAAFAAWNRRSADTCGRQCEGTAHRIESRQQKHRADALAATIRALQDVVTHDGETKADFVARVRAILGADPDARLAHNAGIHRAAEGRPVE